ncbi:general substrate transporter [Tilletiopsis washingtonensis]|uniref:General substrate transporter n=1 Tax=Tilletiopsis washingtonensis TaxID=58919 RepID=A0A316Z7P6_9BASI|nr:general substrate transporter [Tilletiopsis washingtonensis]PWN97619.1 general substrate transporter [Tilletiopsis washingtonensis]
MHEQQSGARVETASAVTGWNAWMVYSCVVIGLSGCMFGIENSIIGPIASMHSFVDKMQGPNPKTGEFVFTASNQSILFSVPLTATIFGALFSTPLQTRFGRKRTLLGAYVFSLPAVFLQLFAPNFGAFVGGRFWNALSYGVATAVAPGYLGDLVVPSLRGRSVALNNLFTITASVISVIICWASESQFRNTRWCYDIPLIVQCALPFTLICLTIFASESPLSLVTRDRIEDARACLSKIRSYSQEEINGELDMMIVGEENRRATAAETSFMDIFKGTNLKRTLVAGSFFSLNQISGIILSTTYATVFLTQLGAGDPFVLSVVAAVCQLAGALVAPFALDLWGRRSVALCGFVVLFLLDVAAGTSAFFTDKGMGPVKAVAAFSFIFNFVWTASFYSISLLLPSEIPTQRLRNPTLSYAVGWGQTTAVITTFAVPQLTSADGANLGAKTYLIFAGCVLCVFVMSIFLLPETAGRSFPEIDELYEKKIPAWRWKGYVCETAAKQGATSESLAKEKAEKAARS